MASHRFTAATSKEALVEAKKRLGPDARLLERRVIHSPSGRKLIEIVVADASQKPAAKRPKKLLASIAIASLVAATAIASLLLLHPWSQQAPLAGSEGTFRIIVLPFENLGGEEQEYFTEGMADEITTRLTKIPDLEVISFSTAKRYKLNPQPTDVIRAEMGVDLIVSGSVKWDGSNGDISRARITPRLIRADSDSQLWAKTYDLEQEDIFAVQAEIAERVADVCGIALMDKDKSKIQRIPTDNIEAYKEYLFTKYCDAYPGYEWDTIAQHADRAAELDPDFAEAMAWVAQAHTGMALMRAVYSDYEQHIGVAYKAAKRAMELAPDLPEANIALAYYLSFVENDKKQAVAVLENAIQQGMRSYDVLTILAHIYTSAGNYEKAIELHIEAGNLRLPYKQPDYYAGLRAIYIHDFERADKLLRRSICGSPTDWCGETLIAELYLYEGETNEAHRILNKVRREAPWASTHHILVLHSVRLDVVMKDYDSALAKLISWTSPSFFSRGEYNAKQWWLAFVHGLMGNEHERRECLDSLILFLEKKIQAEGNVAAYHGALGLAYADAGRFEEAISEGMKGIELANQEVRHIASTPRLKEMAYIYMLAGDFDLAIEYMEKYLTNPCRYAPKMLELDPRWRPLRAHPRFEELASLY